MDINQFDVVFCSDLQRAIDSAKYTFEGLKEISTGKMQGFISTGEIESVRAEISKDWGECVSIGEEAYTTEVKQKGKLMAAIQKIVSYENIDVVYTISFDKEMKLAGLHIVEKAEEENQE